MVHYNVRVTDSHGNVVNKGDKVTDFRGEEATFRYVSARGRTGTWKVAVERGDNSLHEYYARVFGLTVEEI